MTCRKTKEWSNKKLRKFRLKDGEKLSLNRKNKKKYIGTLLDVEGIKDMSYHMGGEGPPLLAQKIPPRVPEQLKAIGEIRKILYKVKLKTAMSVQTTIGWRFFVYNVVRPEGKVAMITLDIEVKNAPSVFRKFTIHRYMKYIQGNWSAYDKTLHNFGEDKTDNIEEFLTKELNEVIDFIEQA